MNKRWIAILAGVLAPVMVAQADYNQGLSAYQRGDYREARSQFEPVANSGHARAQYMLGRLYELGDGVLQDYVQAHKWYNLAAANGHREARSARDRVARRMDAEELSRAQRQARDFRPTDSGYAASGPSATSDKALIADVQKMLGELGYDAGPADGVMGQRTRNAISTYQGHSGMRKDGKPSLKVRNALATDLGYPLTGAVSKPAPAAPVGASATAASAGASSRYSSTYGAKKPAQDANMSAMVSRLTKLIDDAERARAADPQFLADLRNALAEAKGSAATPAFTPAPVPAPVTRPQPAPPRVFIEDQFADGDYQRNPSWRISSGRFSMDRYGMRSRVDTGKPEAPADGKKKKNEIPLALLGALLGAQNGGGSGGSASNPPPPADSRPAEAHVAADLPSAVTFKARITKLTGPGRIEFGLYDTRTLYTGPRIMLHAKGRPEIMLYRYSSGRADQMASYRGNLLSTTDGNSYDFELRRSADGRITISLDGRRIISTNDTLGNRRFGGFVIRNLEGDFALESVMVESGS